MTYVIGWHDGSSAYLVADTAIAHHGAPHEPLSSMGEQPHVDKSGIIYEELSLKIMRLGVSCLASYSGDMQGALWFLEALTPYVDDAELAQRFAHIERAQGPFSAKRESEHFELVLARIVSGRTELLHYSSRSPRHLGLAPVGSGHDIGSLPDKYRSSVRSICARTLQERKAGDYALAIALGMLHQMASTEYFLQHGVGGAFVGARIGLDGARWQPDCRFVFYDPREFLRMRFTSEPPAQMATMQSTHFIRTALVQNAAVVESSYWYPRVRVIVGHGNVSKDEWIAQWSEDAWARLDNTEAPIWVFVSTTTRRVTVLDRMATGDRWAHRVGDGGYAFSADLAASLIAPVPDGNGMIEVIGASPR